MKNILVLSVLFLAAAWLSGCSAIEDMINDQTARTLDLSQQIQNKTAERSPHHATIVENLTIMSGQTITAPAVSAADLDEAIGVASGDLADTFFFLAARVRNLGSTAAKVDVALIPNDASGTAVYIAPIYVGANQTLDIDLQDPFITGADVINDRIVQVVSQLDENYLLVPVVALQGGSGAGVVVDQLKITALPTYLRHEDLSETSIGDYSNHIDRIYDTKLLGSITNLGAASAQIRMLLTEGEGDDAVSTLVAEAVLDPGQTITAEEMLVEGGNELIEKGLEAVVDGDTVFYDYAMVSLDDLVVKSNDLRVETKVDVSANIF